METRKETTKQETRYNNILNFIYKTNTNTIKNIQDSRNIVEKQLIHLVDETMTPQERKGSLTTLLGRLENKCGFTRNDNAVNGFKEIYQRYKDQTQINKRQFNSDVLMYIMNDFEPTYSTIN